MGRWVGRQAGRRVGSTLSIGQYKNVTKFRHKLKDKVKK